jgi:Ni,Fe-hydrogenase I small subunit
MNEFIKSVIYKLQMVGWIKLQECEEYQKSILSCRTPPLTTILKITLSLGVMETAI